MPVSSPASWKKETAKIKTTTAVRITRVRSLLFQIIYSPFRFRLTMLNRFKRLAISYKVVIQDLNEKKVVLSLIVF